MTSPETLIQIPVIDFQPFLGQESEAAQRAVSRGIFCACHEIGFFYLTNHGVPQSLIDQLFDQSKWLFSQPFEEKQKLAWSDAFSNRGYVGVERERLDETKPGDLKEAFNVGREVPANGSCPTDKAALLVNLFPEGNETFRETVLTFFDECCAAADRILQAFAIALQLPQDFFLDSHSDRCNTLRLLHYPPVTAAPKPDQIRAGEHTDYGSITLLFQDDVGGLEVQTLNGKWIAAPCISGAVIVNTGDLMQRWTNHVFCSTRHRVGVPADPRLRKSRYSVAFFCHPNDEATIACLPTCQSAEQPALYPPISAGDYLLSRLQATY
jgi:isopenicillin N synthase-like dioxygenase